MAFAVVIALSVARKDSSAVQIRNKQNLYRALTDRETLGMILEQGLDHLLRDEETLDDTSKFEQLYKNNRQNRRLFYEY